MASPLTYLADLLLLNQQVKDYTSKLNIIYIIFYPDELVNYITTTDTFLSDHHIINVSTCLVVPQSIFPTQSLKPSKTVFGKLDFNSSNWSQMGESFSPLVLLIFNS